MNGPQRQGGKAGRRSTGSSNALSRCRVGAAPLGWAGSQRAAGRVTCRVAVAAAPAEVSDERPTAAGRQGGAAARARAMRYPDVVSVLRRWAGLGRKGPPAVSRAELRSRLPQQRYLMNGPQRQGGSKEPRARQMLIQRSLPDCRAAAAVWVGIWAAGGRTSSTGGAAIEAIDQGGESSVGGGGINGGKEAGRPRQSPSGHASGGGRSCRAGK